MSSNDKLEELAHPTYWDERYVSPTEDSYEWFKNYDQIREFVEKHIPDKSSSIINLGCGNSLMSPTMHEEGYCNIANIDFSKIIIEKMSEKYPEQTWKVADVRETGYPDGHFDTAIDKGTLDAMLSGSLWNPPDHVKERTTAYIDEIIRILKPAGKLLYITYRQPHFIKPIVVREDVWDLDIEKLTEGGGMFEYFAYVLTMKSG
ncbi:hypothetical protein TWF569_005401 [Orbilia oligospora]|uniref:Methyltransferase type 11 domain-containing protein n=3 Tax=Orbilia oligospora TaxID=2813651 RepID=A0A7C8N345_ORBOL|nr:hypothetical protein TWF102_002554 [Orbilia oligospora]KAF3079856.1 hypothetical protein TWF102_002554 [Orbilia oligospora]KAF3100054.1 hypothetical protein TWF103_008561 [Orbilia oligospora]KAF3101721.1 hypothetical protein TWF706_005479 [Orbilia oligospora]KAF3101723.1 hypothetical protein TWF706_005479 [Orbilia oligospora]